MEAPFQIIVYLATGFAGLSPVIFIAIRESIKRQRQEIITDLATVFEMGDGSSPSLIPSFEFVKYKYFVGGKRYRDPSMSRSEADRVAALPLERRRKREDYSTLSWLIGCMPFSVLAGVAVFYFLSLLLSLLAPHTSQPDALICRASAIRNVTVSESCGSSRFAPRSREATSLPCAISIGRSGTST